jgi:RNA polymerase sigma-70 factor, ECF subfamily
MTTAKLPETVWDTLAIWETFHQALGRFIRSRVDDAATADDLLQDVYVKIHTHLCTLRDETNVQAWVYQVARNTVHDYYRRRRPVLLDDEVLARIPDEGDEPENIVEILASGVREMLNCLPDEYREALILTEYEGMTQKELAAHLGISLSGAKSRVQRARQKLRESYMACCHFQFDRLGKVIDYSPQCDCACNNCSP